MWNWANYLTSLHFHLMIRDQSVMVIELIPACKARNSTQYRVIFKEKRVYLLFHTLGKLRASDILNFLFKTTQIFLTIKKMTGNHGHYTCYSRPLQYLLFYFLVHCLLSLLQKDNAASFCLGSVNSNSITVFVTCYLNPPWLNLSFYNMVVIIMIIANVYCMHRTY
jgi:hypothetical protein